MDVQLKRGLLDVCVLAAIKNEDSYGYRIIKDMKPYLELSESTLYTILKRLELGGMLTVRSAEHDGRLRKYYHITEKGLRRIEEFKDDWREIVSIYRFVTKSQQFIQRNRARLEIGCRHRDRLPSRRQRLFVSLVRLGRNSNERVKTVLKLEKPFLRQGRFVLHDFVSKHKQPRETGTKVTFPTDHADQIVLRNPVSPVLLVLHARGESPPLDIHQPGTSLPGNQKVRCLQRGKLLLGNQSPTALPRCETQDMELLKVRFKRALVVVLWLHRCWNDWRMVGN